MDIEFHYYITYILAKRAGFSSNDAQTIAYACQLTDDNSTEIVIDKGKPTEYSNYISQTMNIFKPQSDRLKIYPCFHFIPGDFNCDSAKRIDGKTHEYNTTPNSQNVNGIFDKVLQTDNLYHIGICAHGYADTWAHQNFVGCDDEFNRIFGLLEMFIPNIGHADAEYRPDIPGLLWVDQRLIQANQRINNKARFLEAAGNLFHKFFKYNNKNATDNAIGADWKQLENELSIAIGKESENTRQADPERIDRYMILAQDLVDYDKQKWFNDAVERTGNVLIRKPNFENSNWYKFQEAVKAHQESVFTLVYGQIATRWMSQGGDTAVT